MVTGSALDLNGVKCSMSHLTLPAPSLIDREGEGSLWSSSHWRGCAGWSRVPGGHRAAEATTRTLGGWFPTVEPSHDEPPKGETLHLRSTPDRTSYDASIVCLYIRALFSIQSCLV